MGEALGMIETKGLVAMIPWTPPKGLPFGNPGL